MNRGFDDLNRFFIVKNDQCNCYVNNLKVKKFKMNKKMSILIVILPKKDSNNYLIESITESLAVTENKHNNTKETRVAKWAKIKQSFIDKSYLNLNRNQLVFSMSSTEGMCAFKKQNFFSI